MRTVLVEGVLAFVVHLMAVFGTLFFSLLQQFFVVLVLLFAAISSSKLMVARKHTIGGRLSVS